MVWELGQAVFVLCLLWIEWSYSCAMKLLSYKEFLWKFNFLEITPLSFQHCYITHNIIPFAQNKIRNSSHFYERISRILFTLPS